jgi:hypothetical protein
MSEQKRQHYVPIFYLKLFSTGREKRRISLFHLGQQRLIPDVKIVRQAYKDNFYGSDRVFEKAFGLIEGRSAEVISDMITNNNHPSYYTQEHHVILTFVTMLHARTLYSAEALNESVERTIKAIFSKDPRVKDHLDEVKVGLRNPAQWAVQNVASMIHIVADLGYKLLVNETTTPFLTSDHPVVFYNQFFETRRTWGSNTGLASKGLQIFLPLSPKHLIVFFDQDVYKMSGFFHRPVRLKDPMDIDQLNALQLVNAHTNLYFNQDISAEYIKSLFSQFSSFRRTTKSDVKEFVGGKNEKGYQQSLIQMSRRDVRCGLSLSCVTSTKEAKRFKLDNRAVYVRNETIMRVSDEFTSLVSAGKYKPGEFQKFFGEHYGSRFKK